MALLPSMALADPTAADYFVHSLPGAPDGPLLKMHAGHIEVTPEQLVVFLELDRSMLTFFQPRKHVLLALPE